MKNLTMKLLTREENAAADQLLANVAVRPQSLSRGGTQPMSSSLVDDLEQLRRDLDHFIAQQQRKMQRRLEQRNRDLERQLTERPTRAPVAFSLPAEAGDLTDAQIRRAVKEGHEHELRALILREPDPMERDKLLMRAATAMSPISIEKDARLAAIAPIVEEVAARQRSSGVGHYSPEERNALDHDARHQGRPSTPQMGGGRFRPGEGFYQPTDPIGAAIAARERAGHGGVEALEERSTLNRDPEHIGGKPNAPRMGGTGSGEQSTTYVPTASGEVSGSAQVVERALADRVGEQVRFRVAAEMHPAKRNRRTK